MAASISLTTLNPLLKLRSIKNDNGTKLKCLDSSKDPVLSIENSREGQCLVIGSILCSNSLSTGSKDLHIYDLFHDPHCKSGLLNILINSNCNKDITLNIRIDKTTRDKAKSSCVNKMKLLEHYGIHDKYAQSNVKELNFDHVLINFDLFWRNHDSDSWILLSSIHENLYDEKHINNNSPNIEKLIPYKNKYGIVIEGKKSFMRKYDYFVEVRSMDGEYRRIDKLCSKKKQFGRFYAELNSDTDRYLRIASDHFCSKEILLKTKYFKNFEKIERTEKTIPALKIVTDADDVKQKGLMKILNDLDTTNDFNEILTDEFIPLDDIEASFSPEIGVEFTFQELYAEEESADIPEVCCEMEVETTLTGVLNPFYDLKSLLLGNSIALTKEERDTNDAKSQI